MAGNVPPSLPPSVVAAAASTSTANGGGASTVASGKSKSQANDFMQLLVAQMTHQSPLNPTSSDQFMQQMAQLQMVSEMQDLNSNLTDWASTQALAGASGLIGHTVTLQDASATTSGVVQSVSSQQGKVQVVVGGRAYDMASVLEVK